MSIATLSEIPTIIAPYIDILHANGWRGKFYFWNPSMAKGDFRSLEYGDFVATFQRDFQVLEIVLHKNLGMQYVYSFNGEFEQKYTVGGRQWGDFLSDFI